MYSRLDSRDSGPANAGFRNRIPNRKKLFLPSRKKYFLGLLIDFLQQAFFMFWGRLEYGGVSLLPGETALFSGNLIKRIFK